MSMASAAKPRVSITQRFGERPRNQVDNIVEMPLLPNADAAVRCQLATTGK